jgi:hypothetical protein
MLTIIGSQAQKKRDFTKYIAESTETVIEDETLLLWRRYAQITYSVFRDPLEELQRTPNLKMQNVIAFDKTQQTMRPAYFICVDEETESVLVIFRGTKSFSDLITDLHCSSIRHKYGYCHKGMLIAAQWFYNNRFIKQILHRTLELYPDYKLRLLGHSLGGGTAAILSTLWREQEFPTVKSYAFACPPILSNFLAGECADYVTSFVNGDDFVVRLSMTAIEELRKDVSEYPWKEEMMRDIQNTAIVKFASGVKSYASGIFSRGVGLVKAGASYAYGTVETVPTSINGEQLVQINAVPSAPESSPVRLPPAPVEEMYPSIPLEEKELDDVVSDSSSPSSIVQVSFTEVNSGESSPKDPNRKRRRKGKTSDADQAHFIINEYENLVVSLFPAGKIYQIRLIEDKVHIKNAKQEEYTKIILSESWKEDHRMIHYQNNLLAYPTKKELATHEELPNSPTDFIHLSVGK